MNHGDRGNTSVSALRTEGREEAKKLAKGTWEQKKKASKDEQGKEIVLIAHEQTSKTHTT